jgi:endonuclease III
MRRKETVNERINRTRKILTRLKSAFPEATTALQHRSALEMLIATILSAQCTDKRVNQVTIPLFKKYRTAVDYARSPQQEIEMIIRSTGFYHSKAKNIIGCCRILVEHHGGSVPDTMPELLQLPGVGRKTANVVLGNFFGKAEGIVVDTHVKRISGRLGLTRYTTPEKIEQDLIELVPKKDWIPVSNLFILHGRKSCRARKPDCTHCPIAIYCPSAHL